VVPAVTTPNRLVGTSEFIGLDECFYGSVEERVAADTTFMKAKRARVEESLSALTVEEEKLVSTLGARGFAVLSEPQVADALGGGSQEPLGLRVGAQETLSKPTLDALDSRLDALQAELVARWSEQAGSLGGRLSSDGSLRGGWSKEFLNSLSVAPPVGRVETVKDAGFEVFNSDGTLVSKETMKVDNQLLSRAASSLFA